MKKRIMIFFEIAQDITIVRRALMVAIVVGIILNLINQGSAIISFEFERLNLGQAAFTFVVPFMVSTYSSVLLKVSMKPGELITINSSAKCKKCNSNQVELIRGNLVPYCKYCGDATKWKLPELKPSPLNNRV